jgi:hypothetical protein
MSPGDWVTICDSWADRRQIEDRAASHDRRWHADYRVIRNPGWERAEQGRVANVRKVQCRCHAQGFDGSRTRRHERARLLRLIVLGMEPWCVVPIDAARICRHSGTGNDHAGFPVVRSGFADWSWAIIMAV